MATRLRAASPDRPGGGSALGRAVCRGDHARHADLDFAAGAILVRPASTAAVPPLVPHGGAEPRHDRGVQRRGSASRPRVEQADPRHRRASIRSISSDRGTAYGKSGWCNISSSSVRPGDVMRTAVERPSESGAPASLSSRFGGRESRPELPAGRVDVGPRHRRLLARPGDLLHGLDRGC